MSETIITTIVQNALEVVLAIFMAILSVLVIPWLKKSVIPWLKEKHLFSMVYSFVRAAEKLADSGTLEKTAKKSYVIDLLRQKGITITDEVLATIESAVEELDISLNKGVELITGTFDEANTDTAATNNGDDTAAEEPAANESSTT